MVAKSEETAALSRLLAGACARPTQLLGSKHTRNRAQLNSSSEELSKR